MKNQFVTAANIKCSTYSTAFYRVMKFLQHQKKISNSFLREGQGFFKTHVSPAKVQ